MRGHHHILIFTLFSACLAVCLSACGDDSPQPAATPTPPPNLSPDLLTGWRFVHDPAARREMMLQSFVEPTNGYSQLRARNYALPDQGWDALPEWAPPIRPITTQDIGALASAPWRATEGDFEPSYQEVAWTHEALIEAGKRAFERYPLQVDMATSSALDDERALARSGHWIDDRSVVGGLVRAKLDNGQEGTAKTCSTCHAKPLEQGGPLIHGRSNADFDLGRLMAEHYGQAWRHALNWGPGQADVTNDNKDNAAAMIDLRPIRHQRRLHWAATLHNSLGALAVRVDTLIITSHSQRQRPPRQLSFAIAYYLWSLGAPPETQRALTEQERRGQQLFMANCAACHHEDGSVGEPIPLEVIGTDPAVGLSSERGTGAYRVPSLWLVGDRTQYFHHGGARSLEQLLDPARLKDSPGHEFGLTLEAAQRQDLIAFLRQLGRP